MMSIAYPIRHWLTSLILAPALMLLYMGLSERDLDWVLGIYLLCLVIGLFLSFPVFLLYLFVFKKLVKTNIPTWLIKTILNIVALSGTGIIYLLVGDLGSLADDLYISYAVAIIIASFIFRLRSGSRESEEHTEP